MNKHSSNLHDSYNSLSSNSKGKYINTKRSIVSYLDDYKNNIKEMPKDLKEHFKLSKNENHNDTLNDILINMMRKEERLLDYSRNRDSIIHNIDIKNIGVQRKSSNKGNIYDRNSRGSLQCRKSSVKSLVKSLAKCSVTSSKKTKSVTNSKEKSKKLLDMSNIMNYSFVELNVNNKNFYDRQMIQLEKKKLDIEYIKNQRRVEEMKINTNRPKISENSLKIVNEKFKEQKPIHLRTAEILEMKKLEEMQLIQKVKMHQIEKENISKRNKSKKKTSFKNCEDNEIQGSPVTRWLKKVEMYEQIKEKKIENMKSKIQAKRDADSSFSFKPDIDKTSDLLAKMKFSNDENNLNKSAFDRLHEEKEKHSKRIEKLVNDHKPSFSPFINPTKKYSDYKNKKNSFLKYLTQNQGEKEKDFNSGSNKKSDHESIIDINLFDFIPYKNNHKNVSVDFGQNEFIQDESAHKNIGYKINIRSNSAWMKEKENQVILKRKMPNTLKSFI